MRTLMALSTQTNQIAQTMRIIPAPPLNVMHLLARAHPTMLADAPRPLVHGLSPFRVHRVPLPTTVRHGLHRISLRTASSNVFLSTAPK